jgi:hypothetical protein
MERKDIPPIFLLLVTIRSEWSLGFFPSSTKPPSTVWWRLYVYFKYAYYPSLDYSLAVGT